MSLNKLVEMSNYELNRQNQSDFYLTFNRFKDIFPRLTCMFYSTKIELVW